MFEQTLLKVDEVEQKLQKVDNILFYRIDGPKQSDKLFVLSTTRTNCNKGSTSSVV